MSTVEDEHSVISFDFHVLEAVRGIMTVIDVDWQISSEIWGLVVEIPGVLKADFKPGSHQYITTRMSGESHGDGIDTSSMTRYKRFVS